MVVVVEKDFGWIWDFTNVSFLRGQTFKNFRSGKPRIEIFNFGLDRKIPKIPTSRGSESGFENLAEIPSEKSRETQNPRDRDRDFKSSKKPRRNPE